MSSASASAGAFLVLPPLNKLMGSVVRCFSGLESGKSCPSV